MSKVLKNPIAVKSKKAQSGPWSFIAPSKDVATSGNLCAGNDYGVGHRQPVGKEMAGSMESGPIPQQSKCFSADVIFGKEDQRG